VTALRGRASKKGRAVRDPHLPPPHTSAARGAMEKTGKTGCLIWARRMKKSLHGCSQLTRISGLPRGVGPPRHRSLLMRQTKELLPSALVYRPQSKRVTPRIIASGGNYVPSCGPSARDRSGEVGKDEKNYVVRRVGLEVDEPVRMMKTVGVEGGGRDGGSPWSSSRGAGPRSARRCRSPLPREKQRPRGTGARGCVCCARRGSLLPTARPRAAPRASAS
jgi:hypothetical protein